MSLLSIAFVFAITWWLVLFTVLPWGVRTPQEANAEMEPGQAPSAPVKPRLLLKFAVTTLITAILCGALYGVVEAGILDLRSLFEVPREG